MVQMCVVIWVALKITQVSPLLLLTAAMPVTSRLHTSTGLTSRGGGSFHLLKSIQENGLEFIKSGSGSLSCKQMDATGIICETGVVLDPCSDLVLLL